MLVLNDEVEDLVRIMRICFSILGWSGAALLVVDKAELGDGVADDMEDEVENKVEVDLEDEVENMVDEEDGVEYMMEVDFENDMVDKGSGMVVGKLGRRVSVRCESIFSDNSRSNDRVIEGSDLRWADVQSRSK